MNSKREKEINIIEEIQERYKVKGIDTFSFCNVNSEVINNIFSSISPNNNENDFPDFIFNDGILEIYEVTSAKETRKGSNYKQEYEKNERNNKKRKENTVNTFLKSMYIPHTISVTNYENSYSDFTYENFIISLEKNTKNHINSLEKYDHCNKLVVFLMNYNGGNMFTMKNNVVDQIYSLHRDKKSLQILKEYKNSVDVFIFVMNDAIEIIDMKTIEELISLSKNLNYVCGRNKNIEISLYIDI